MIKSPEQEWAWDGTASPKDFFGTPNPMKNKSQSQGFFSQGTQNPGFRCYVFPTPGHENRTWAGFKFVTLTLFMVSIVKNFFHVPEYPCLITVL